MSKSDGWSREQLLIALKLYCETQFGKMHARNPEIIRCAGLIGRTPSALAMKLTNFASLDPEIRSSGRKGLSKASQADKELWNEMTSDWDKLAVEIERCELNFGDGRQILREQSETAVPIDYSGANRNAIVALRIGQSFFRSAVLSAYDFKCCITGLGIPDLLVASHIIPWSVNTRNRLNPRNGLCLSAIHDRAFDLGLISISADYSLLSAKILCTQRNSYLEHTFIKYAGRPITIPEKFIPDAEFLEYHRDHIFRG